MDDIDLTLVAEPVLTASAGPDMYEYVRARESSARTYANAVDRVIERGYLSRVWDSEGREYLDFLACAGTLATGHNHPAVNAAVQDFLGSGHVVQALDLTTPVKYRFLTELFAILPEPFSRHAKVQFCGPTGADAVEAAIKLFKSATGRRTVLAFHGGYHGMTSGALSVTGNLNAKNDVAGLMPDVHFLPYPYAYRCPFGLGGDATWRTSLTYVEQLLTDPESGITKPAAMILEAVQGEGGVIPAPAEWLRGIRRITAEHDIPLILDEVQAGIGRTGWMFAFEHAGIEPDAIILSKAIGGGFPMSLMVYNDRFDRWRPGAHAGTFRGNQIAMVAGAATLQVMREEGLVEAARTKGHYLQQRLHALRERYPVIGDVRGRGLMWGLEIVDPAGPADAIGSRPGDGARARDLRRYCLEAGLILETGGRHGAVLRMLPPLTVSISELDEMCARLETALRRLAGTHG